LVVFACGGLTRYDCTAAVVPGDEVDADASRLTTAKKRQDDTKSVTSFGIRYVVGLWNN
jgi:hypothetical protein